MEVSQRLWGMPMEWGMEGSASCGVWANKQILFPKVSV